MQVVSNLVSNALKFTAAGGRVDVTLESGDGFGVLTVRDNGAGIAADFLPHVFDCFRQAEGLGLAIARHLVDLHSGTIAAESAGPGTARPSA